MSKFRKWVAAQGGTRATARLLGLSNSAVSNWLTGKNGISKRHIALILRKTRRSHSPLELKDLYNVS